MGRTYSISNTWGWTLGSPVLSAANFATTTGIVVDSEGKSYEVKYEYSLEFDEADLCRIDASVPARQRIEVLWD